MERGCVFTELIFSFVCVLLMSYNLLNVDGFLSMQ